MTYNIRLRLSSLCFRLGKIIHPDIAKLKKEIKEAQDRIQRDSFLLGIK